MHVHAPTTTRDLDGLLADYADDVVSNLPVAAVQFRGKSEVAALMTDVLSGFETSQRTLVLAERANACSERGRIRGRDIELAELIRVDSHRRVAEIVIHGRPLSRRRRHRRGRGTPAPRPPRPNPSLLARFL